MYEPLISKINRVSLSLTRVDRTKEVINAFHVFWTVAFPLPISVIQHIKALCRDFLVLKDTTKKRIHTVAWDQIGFANL